MSERDFTKSEAVLFHESRISAHLGATAIQGIERSMFVAYGDQYQPPLLARPEYEHGDVDSKVYAASLNKIIVAASCISTPTLLPEYGEKMMVSMLRDSDNQAFRDLVTHIGPREINNFSAVEVGLLDTELAIRENGDFWTGFTTARESAQLLRYLLDQTQSGDRELGRKVRGALERSNIKYGIRPRLKDGSALLMNKTGEDYKTTDDEDVGKVAVHHDVGYLEPMDDREGTALVYAITSTAPSVRLAKQANRIIGDIGVELIKIAGGDTRTHIGAQALRILGR